MTKYLVAFSVIHNTGSSCSREFIEQAGSITEDIIRDWEQMLRKPYEKHLKNPIIRVMSFQIVVSY